MTLFSLVATAQENPDGWKLESDNNGIQIYTQYLDDLSLRSFKVITTVQSTLPQTLMFLHDMDESHRWVSMLKSAKTLQAANSHGVSYHHMSTDLPWPIRDRDLVVKTQIRYDEELAQVTIQSKAVPDFVPESKGAVRIQLSLLTWKITKLNDGSLRLELTSYAAAGGNIPKWLANMTLLQLPRYMFSRLPEILESEEVKNLEFDAMKVFGAPVVLK